MKLNIVNTAELFDPDTVIKNVDIYGHKIKSTEKREYTEDGLFSPSIFGNIDASADTYSCACGHTEGKIYEGTTCPKCKSKVTLSIRNITRNGWIDLSGNKYDSDGNINRTGKNYRIVKFIHYLQLEKIIGPSVLRSIIMAKNAIDLNGDIDEALVEAERNEAPENKYLYLGLLEFYDRYDEVLDYYAELNDKKNTEIYDFVKNRDEVFTSKICVISPLLRPAVRTSTGVKLDQINKYYMTIVKSNNIVNNNTVNVELSDIVHMSIIQSTYFKLCQYVINILSGKQGLIRNNICGTRINFCGRNIITPSKVGRKIDEIVLPYVTFAVMWKFELINLIKKMKGCSTSEAHRIWHQATFRFDEEMYTLMLKIIKDNKVGVLLNRKHWIAA